MVAGRVFDGCSVVCAVATITVDSVVTLSTDVFLNGGSRVTEVSFGSTHSETQTGSREFLSTLKLWQHFRTPAQSASKRHAGIGLSPENRGATQNLAIMLRLNAWKRERWNDPVIFKINELTSIDVVQMYFWVIVNQFFHCLWRAAVGFH